VILLFAVMDAPYIPFGTTLALDYLERRGQLEQFGPLRLWGSVGYIVSALGIGALLLEHRLALLPYVFAGVMFLSGLLSLLLPAAVSSGQTFHWRDSLTLLTGRSEFGWFLFGIALCGSTMAIGSQYLSIYLEQLQAAGWMIGLAIGLQAATEIPLMGSMPAILRRFGVRAALLAGVAVLPLRWFLHVVLQQPLFLLPVQLLHGFTISGVMVVGALWVNGRLPLHLRATGQALYTAVFAGVGWGLGLLVAGAVNDWFGMSAVWTMATVVSIVGVLIVRAMLRGDWAHETPI
jgi:PPP family 3-phenylpropionic acid transporter